MVKQNLEQVLERIAQAARSVGRDPVSIRLISVTKGVPLERIREALACGVREIGENRVQEAKEKRAFLSGADLRWHLIGHLQRNKVKYVAGLFDVIHSVDSLELIHELERHATGRRLEVLVQVNVSGESTKHGCVPDQAKPLVEAITKSRNLALAGFMTMAPFSDNPESTRLFFRELRRLRDQVDASLHLSMGMSQDFEVAIQEGSTMVRIGTAIFGER